MEEEKIAGNVLMIRPHNFGFNKQTSGTNKFQKKSFKSVNQKALYEFNNAVNKLRENGIRVVVFDDLSDKDTPDSVFPNNWISFHSTGDVVLYPMLAENRRAERRKDIIDKLCSEYDFYCDKIIDFTKYEKKGMFLEGTGSLVLDRKNRLAYSSVSERTNRDMLIKFCRKMNYEPVIFKAYDKEGFPVYHTNVVMSVCPAFVIVCLDAIKDEGEKNNVISKIEKTGKRIIDISFDQMINFAGNALELMSVDGRKKLVISQKALDSLSRVQINLIKKYCDIIGINVNTIEECGGGSIRCMLAEVFLPLKKRIKNGIRTGIYKINKN